MCEGIKIYNVNHQLTALQVQHTLLFIHRIFGQVHITRHRRSDSRNKTAQLVETRCTPLQESLNNSTDQWFQPLRPGIFSSIFYCFLRALSQKIMEMSSYLSYFQEKQEKDAQIPQNLFWQLQGNKNNLETQH